ncbi:hypothetical protein RhiJN_06774 [Ceratobasidium sp. AG-Ba]|nr:hypothetical protein RhiJN_06774 [Ceratobasidium sp. AG-Ba]
MLGLGEPQDSQAGADYLKRLHPGALPALSTIRVPHHFFEVLIPGRPISSVAGTDEFNSIRDFDFTSFRKSTTPITTLELEVWHLMQFKMLMAINCLYRLRIGGGLRSLSIISRQVTPPVPEEELDCMSMYLSILGALPALERLEMVCDQAEPHDLDRVKACLGDLCSMGKWRKFAPGLKFANVYGVEIS